MSANADARIVGVIGASGQGKGVWLKGLLLDEAPARLVVWDFMDEYGEVLAQLKGRGGQVKAAGSLDGVRKAMIKAGEGPLLVRYVPRGAGEKALRVEFEALCEMVYAWGQCTFVAEELANVTTPSWAPASWRKMTTSGRHKEVRIYGVTQSPALVDKSFLGNCTLVHCCALREHAHRVAVARAMDIQDAELATLIKFEYMEKDYETGEVTRASVKPPGKKRAAPAAKRP